MQYIEKIKSDLIQLESYARTCMRLITGMDMQGKLGNYLLDTMLQGVYRLEFDEDLSDMMYIWLPECRITENNKIKETALYKFIINWVHDYCIKCKNCTGYVLESEVVRRDIGFVCENCDEELGSETPLSDMADIYRKEQGY